MKQVIHIGKSEVPLADYAIGATAILGIRDSGKTVTAKGIAEQLLESRIPIVVFDAVGKWRWMKFPGPKSGEHLKIEGKGFPIVVAGGRAPDLPLTPHSVEEIVRSALKERIPLIIDLYDAKLSKSDWRRIVQTAIRIIHYENEGGPLHVFLEEAAEYAPQKVQDGQTYAEVEKLVRMGGNASVGITMINQRSQELNKAVLDLCTTLVLGCQIGNKAIEAVEKWVDRLDPGTAEAVTTSLPRLVSGEAWVWTRQSPDHPTREKVPMCRSFHPDRRTPECLVNAIPKVDAAQFVARMAKSIPKVIEAAKATDPAELKKEISRLKTELAKKPKPEPAAQAVTTVKEVPVLTPAERSRLTLLIKAFDKVYEAAERHYAEQQSLSKVTNDLKPEIKFFKDKLTGRHDAPIPQAVAPRRAFTPPPRPSPVRQRNVAPTSNGDDWSPSKCARAILTVLAQFGPSHRRKVALVSGYSSKSGGFNNSLSELRSHGCMDGNSVALQITAEGEAALGDWTPIPTGEALGNYWVNRLGQCPSKILEYLLSIYPESVCRQQIGEATGYSETSGGFNNSLSELRTLELIDDHSDRTISASGILKGE